MLTRTVEIPPKTIQTPPKSLVRPPLVRSKIAPETQRIPRCASTCSQDTIMGPKLHSKSLRNTAWSVHSLPKCFEIYHLIHDKCNTWNGSVHVQYSLHINAAMRLRRLSVEGCRHTDSQQKPTVLYNIIQYYTPSYSIRQYSKTICSRI